MSFEICSASAFIYILLKKPWGRKIWSHPVRTSALIPLGLLSWVLKGFLSIHTWQLRNGQLCVLGSNFSQSFFWDGTAVAGRWTLQYRIAQLMGNPKYSRSWGKPWGAWQQPSAGVRIAQQSCRLCEGLLSWPALPGAWGARLVHVFSQRAMCRGEGLLNGGLNGQIRYASHSHTPPTLSSCGCLNSQHSMIGERCGPVGSCQNCVERETEQWLTLLPCWFEPVYNPDGKTAAQ